MNPYRLLILSLFLAVGLTASAQTLRSEISFDDDWRFYKGDAPGAETRIFDDRSWRRVDLPHDWSVEALPNQLPGEVIGPFSKQSPGTTATGYTLGGTAWYRKTFGLKAGTPYKQSLIRFDGVYMNCEVWVNGKLLATHPYGYTAFDVDISNAVKPNGQPNIIAVKVRNEGKTSRWYSGSGIYRHVWLIRKQPVHIAQDGLWATTENLSADTAKIRLSASIENETGRLSGVQLLIKLISPDGKIVQTVKTPVTGIAVAGKQITQYLSVDKPKAWSVENPNLYTAQIQVIANGKVVDKSNITFGIRIINFDAIPGLL